MERFDFRLWREPTMGLACAHPFREASGVSGMSSGRGMATSVRLETTTIIRVKNQPKAYFFWCLGDPIWRSPMISILPCDGDGEILS
jgi:hypothetical protein